MTAVPSTQDEDRSNIAVPLHQGAIIAVNHYADPRVSFMAGFEDAMRQFRGRSPAAEYRWRGQRSLR